MSKDDAGRQTAIYLHCTDHAPVAFQTLFGEARRCNDLDYEAAMGALEPKEELKNTASISPSHSKSALPVAASAGFTFNSTAAQPLGVCEVFLMWFRQSEERFEQEKQVIANIVLRMD